MITWRSGSFKSALDFLGSIAFIAACAAIAWTAIDRRVVPSAPPAPAPAPSRPARQELPLPTTPVSLEGAILQGSRTAPIAVIEYSEFQCPYCGKFAAETLPALKKKYVDSGKVLWAFRHFPLEQIHDNAFRAAVAAECAAKQGKFDQMHDLLFANQKELGAVQLDGYAKRAGLDIGAYTSCMRAPPEASIRAHMNDGKSFGVTGTPTFLVGPLLSDGTVKLTKRLFGAATLDAFEKELDALLAPQIVRR